MKRTNAKLGHDRDDLGEVLEEALFLLARKIHERLQGALDGHLRASPFVSANVGIGIVVVSVADGGGSDEVVVVVVVVVGGGGGGGVGGGDGAGGGGGGGAGGAARRRRGRRRRERGGARARWRTTEILWVGLTVCSRMCCRLIRLLCQ